MNNTQSHVPFEDQAQKQAAFCSIFSNPRRVLIMWALAETELSVGAIAEAVGTSIQNVSQHLGIMKAHHIVSARRDGQTIYYRLDEQALGERCSQLIRAHVLMDQRCP